MFRETTVHKWDIVTIHSLFYIPFPARWTLAIAFIGLLVTTNNITSSFVPLNVKGFLVYRRLEKFYTAISSVIDLSNKFVDWKCFGDGWCLMGAFSLNYLIRFCKYTVIIDGKNFMAASKNSLGVWTTIWPGSLLVPPTLSIGTLPWCPSL